MHTRHTRAGWWGPVSTHSVWRLRGSYLSGSQGFARGGQRSCWVREEVPSVVPLRGEGHRALEPQGTEVAFTFWQMGPRLMCCGNSGSEVCQHCRKKSSGCEQNSSAPLQAGKEDETGLQTLHRYPVYKSHNTSAWSSRQPLPLGFHQGL